MAFWPVLAHPDELWQYLEPARHIVAGRWVETWDFRAGVRSWLLPLMLSGPMALGYAIAPLTRLDVLFARLFCVALSMLGVFSSIQLGRRISTEHGFIVGVATAGWFELVYLGPRTSAEPVATAFALIAAHLISRRDPWRTVLAGLFLGLGCAVRVQYLPAFVVLALGMSGIDWRRWLQVVAGAAAGLSTSAAADLTMGAVPFGWIWRNYTVNISQGKAATFGAEPFWWYGTEAWYLLGPGVIAITILMILGAKRYPALFWSALTNLVFHSFIIHKEYRFIFFTSYSAILLAALGSVDVWLLYKSKFLPRVNWLNSPVPLSVIWLVWSGSSAALGAAASTWGVNGRMIAAWESARRVAGSCGVGIYGIQDVPVASYALLSRNIPIYQFGFADRVAGRQSRAYNVALTQRVLANGLKGFSLVSCDRLNYFCVYKRAGLCSTTRSDSFYEENAYLIRLGK